MRYSKAIPPSSVINMEDSLRGFKFVRSVLISKLSNVCRFLDIFF
jgi:hypothetical protein